MHRLEWMVFLPYCKYGQKILKRYKLKVFSKKHQKCFVILLSKTDILFAEQFGIGFYVSQYSRTEIATTDYLHEKVSTVFEYGIFCHGGAGDQF